MTRTDVTEQDRLRAPNTEEQLRRYETAPAREGETSTQVAAGGSMVEAIAGLAALVLAIIGLVSTGNVTFYMLTIATIVVGVAVMLQGASMGARVSSSFGRVGGAGTAEFGSGISAQFLGGAAGIVLGVLAILNVVPLTLVSVSVLVFGSVLLLGGGMASQVSQLETTRTTTYARDMTQAVASGAAGSHALIGLASIILGILALCGINPTILNLVALLTLGAGIALSGTAIAGHMAAALRR